MIDIVNGRVFVEGRETVNPELIGLAILDLAEEAQNSVFHAVSDNKLLSIINTEVELRQLNELIQNEMPILESGICEYQLSFNINWPSSQMLWNLIQMIKSGKLILTGKQ